MYTYNTCAWVSSSIQWTRDQSAFIARRPLTVHLTTYTIASLAKLPAAEVVRLANSSSATGLPLPKADPMIVQATDAFIDGLLEKPIQAQKQALGEKL